MVSISRVSVSARPEGRSDSGRKTEHGTPLPLGTDASFLPAPYRALWHRDRVSKAEQRTARVIAPGLEERRYGATLIRYANHSARSVALLANSRRAIHPRLEGSAGRARRV